MQSSSRERGHDYCLTTVGDEVFALPVARLLRVLAVDGCALRPDLDPPLLGWSDGGEAAFPIARLGHYLEGLADGSGAGERVAVVDTGAGLLGLALDRVLGIATIIATEIRTPSSAHPRLVSGLWPQRSHTVHVLDPTQLAGEVARWVAAEERIPSLQPATPLARAEAERSVGFCFFERRGRHFALPVLAAREVIADQPVTPVPQAPGHVLGVVNLRGNVLPLINADTFLGLPVSLVPESYEALVVESGGVHLGLFVDRVGDVHPIDLLDVRPAPGMDSPGSIYRGVWAGRDADVLLIDVDELVAQAIGATTRSFQRTVSALSGLEEDSDAVADTPS